MSCHAFADAVMILYSQGKMLDFSHTINHLSFGKEESISKIKSITGGYSLSPLDKTVESTRPQGSNGHYHNVYTTYYIHITPTKYLIGEEEEYSAHEFAYSSQTMMTHGMPAVFFRYELNPIFISYQVVPEKFFVFFIR